MNLDEFFKFKVGAVVRHVVCAQVPYDRYSPEQYRFVVTGRTLEECSGGIQRHYTARSVGRSGGTGVNLVHLHELELVASEPFGVDEDEETALERIRRQTRVADCTEAADGTGG